MHPFMHQYTISRGGQNFGPYSEPEIIARLAKGELHPEDSAWRPGIEGWLPLRQLVAMDTKDVPPPGVTTPPWGMPKPKAKKSATKKLLIGCGLFCGVMLIGLVAIVALVGGSFYKNFRVGFAESMLKIEAKQVSAAWLQKSTDNRTDAATVAEIKTIVSAPPSGVKLSVEPGDNPGSLTVVDFTGTSTDTLKINKGDRLVLEFDGYDHKLSRDPEVKKQAKTPSDGIRFEVATGEISPN